MTIRFHYVILILDYIMYSMGGFITVQSLSTCMLNYTITILSLSLSGTLLILILCLFQPLFKNRLSKCWQYYIWLIVIARLLLPFTPKITIMGTLFQEINQNAEQLETVIPSQSDAVYPTPAELSEKISITEPPSTNKEVETKKLTNQFSQEIITSFLKNIWLIWLIIALILFIRKITIYQDFIKYIHSGCNTVEDINLLEQFGRLLEENNVNNVVQLYTNNLISSPLLIGFFHPCIVLPTAEYSDSDFSYIILHELTHYKRKDMFYKWLVQLTICLHWFNPFVYRMGFEINRACELSCDETVIQNLDAGQQQAYGDMLLNAVIIGGSYKNSIASLTLNESKQLLKERLDAIMNFKKKSKLTICITFAATLFLIIGATTIGAYSNPGIENKTSELSSHVSKISNILYEDGVYYIFADEAKEKDKPIGGVTKGSISLCLVEKDNYTTLSGFENPAILVKEVTEQCNFMRNQNRLTQDKANLMIQAAKEIQNSYLSEEENKFIKTISQDDEYAKWGIEKKEDIYYYQNNPIQILIDIKANNPASSSLINFYNSKKQGTICIKIERNKEGIIKNLKKISKKKANKMLKEFNIISNNIESKNTANIKETSKKSSSNVAVTFNSISITGKGPIGVELVKTNSTDVTFEFLGVENEKNCTTKARIIDGVMQIMVNYYAPNSINVNFGPDYKNVVRINIPNAKYTKFSVDAFKMMVQMQDFNASVDIKANIAGFYLIDTTISQGTYNIDVTSGPVYIKADSIQKDITAAVHNGLLELHFDKKPKHLYLDSTNCKPVVERPNSWAALYHIGNKTPNILLINTNGKTVIESP